MLSFGSATNSVCLMELSTFSRWGNGGSEMSPRLQPRATEMKRPTCFFLPWPEYLFPPSYSYYFMSIVYPHGVNPWRTLDFIFLLTMVTFQGPTVFWMEKELKEPSGGQSGGRVRDTTCLLELSIFRFSRIPFLSSPVPEYPGIIM